MLLSRVPAESRGCDGEGHTPPPRLRRGCIGQPGGQAFTRPRDFGPLGPRIILARARDGDRFSTIDNRGRRCLREPAHGLREWPRAMARRGRRLPDLRISAPLGISTHIGAGARRDRFSTIDDRGRRCLREPAHGLRERGRAIARRRSLFADFGYPVTIMLAHIAAWAVEGAVFRPSRSGSGSGLAAAHGLRECGRAITRRRGLFADVGDSLSSRT